MNAHVRMIEAAVLLTVFLSAAHAREIPLSVLDLDNASLANPLLVGDEVVASVGPVWAGDRLFTEPASDLALSRFERHGPPVFDPSSAAWYAWANGTIVRLEGAHAIVVADGVAGHDVDVRAGAGVAVSREPDHSIVLWRLDGRGEPRALLRGEGYFHPRLSPDGTSVLVQASGAGGGRLVLVPRDGSPRDLGPGSDGAFTPDGRGVVFTVVSSDGRRVTSADLYHLDLVSGRRTRLTTTANRAEVEPAISPDGRFIAIVDALSGRLCVARMPFWLERGNSP